MNYIIQMDIFFSVPEDNPLKEMLETAGEIVSQDSDTEQASLAFICKRLKLNFRKLSVEERKWLKKIAEMLITKLIVNTVSKLNCTHN